ncbi:hypothetical protein [Nocardioides convexus]|nr:hypothetical protein [Nocardioides convexus]
MFWFDSGDKAAFAGAGEGGPQPDSRRRRRDQRLRRREGRLGRRQAGSGS